MTHCAISNPLSSHSTRLLQPQDEPTETALATRPFGLRWLHDVPARPVPQYRYCPDRQIAVGKDGHPLVPQLKKEWTTSPYSTDGEDPPAGEEWGWEEV